jgi:DNA-binding SARP family transcriptional activator
MGGDKPVQGAQMSERRVVARRPVPGSGAAGWRLRLLHAFELSSHAVPLELPVGAQRLLALLALLGRPAHRLYLAGVLWPDSSEQHANGSLRSALWRLRASAPGTVIAVGTRLALSPSVRVDFHEVIQRAHRLVEGEAEVGGKSIDPAVLTHELLPDWYDDWLSADRERLRQLQLHALEALSKRLRARADYSQAIEMANMAVAAEPTRESARRELIEAHLAEGNVDEALRQFNLFRELLVRELGVEPSGRLVALVPQVLTSH